jgi:hypothetical protein
MIEISIQMIGENAAGELIDLCKPFDHWVEGFKQVIREQSKYDICAPVESFTDDQIMAIYLYLYGTHIQVKYPNGRLDMVKFAEPTLPGAMRQKLKWLEEERSIRINELGAVEKALGIPDQVDERNKTEMMRISADEEC